MNSLGINDDKGTVILSKEEYAKWISSQANPQNTNPSSSTCAFVQTSGTPSAYLSSSTQRTWVIDSGASDHMTGNADIFSSLTPSSSLPCVTLANGSQSITEGVGTVSPSSNFSLSSVLYVP